MLGEWRSVEAPPPLENDVLHLWRIELALVAPLLPNCMLLLTSEERDRANRRRVGEARDQFVFARSCLRILLGRALQCDPRDVPITENSHGKPETPIVSGRSISYNIAHSKGTVLIALRSQGSVGIDVEHLDRETDIMEVAQASFTPRETMTLAAIENPDRRRRAFYRCWTQKEAVVKADGRGLCLPLSSFEVPIYPAQSTPVRVTEASNGTSKVYFVSEISLGNHVVGAIALDSVCSISMFTVATNGLVSYRNACRFARME